MTFKIVSSVSSSSTTPWMCRTSGWCHIGHYDGVLSQTVPQFHRVEAHSWSYEMPLVSKSVGLSADGLYLHMVEMERISDTQLLTKSFNLFLLNIHDNTIWLSHHKKGLEVMSSNVLTNKHSHTATTAANNSSLGRKWFLSSTALDFDITSVQSFPWCRYATAHMLEGWNLQKYVRLSLMLMVRRYTV